MLSENDTVALNVRVTDVYLFQFLNILALSVGFRGTLHLEAGQIIQAEINPWIDSCQNIQNS